MKLSAKTQKPRGFTLMELMVAMAITTIIVTVLVTITSIATDTWNRSRAELRAMRQGKAMIESIARDLESLVVRKGNEFEWLAAEVPSSLPGDRLKSSNASELYFFTAATDRYEGKIGSTADQGGDVSCVAYQLAYRDPVDSGSTGNNFETFVLNRLLVNPDETFTDLLGQSNLKSAFSSYQSDIEEPQNFVCENVYQFTIVFKVEVPVQSGTSTVMRTVAVPMGDVSNTAKYFRLRGDKIDTDGSSGDSSVSNDALASGRLVGVEVSLTVITDAGIDQLRRRSFSGNQQAEFLAKHSYQYSKLIQVPGL